MLSGRAVGPPVLHHDGSVGGEGQAVVLRIIHPSTVSRPRRQLVDEERQGDAGLADSVAQYGHSVGERHGRPAAVDGGEHAVPAEIELPPAMLWGVDDAGGAGRGAAGRVGDEARTEVLAGVLRVR